MQITIELPEDIVAGLESKWKDLPRAALESLALEAYRSRALTAAQLRRLLAFETRTRSTPFSRSTKSSTTRPRISNRTVRLFAISE
jgi:hypothetical protein